MGNKVCRYKNLTRPRKGPGAKAKRQRDQRKRLIALGMTESEVAAMNSRQVLDALKRPALIAKKCAEKKG